MMRTTLVIDDDVLEAARLIADHRRASIGSIISGWARASLPRPTVIRRANGIPMIPITDPDAVVTMEHVNELRDMLP